MLEKLKNKVRKLSKTNNYGDEVLRMTEKGWVVP